MTPERGGEVNKRDERVNKRDERANKRGVQCETPERGGGGGGREGRMC